MGSFLSFTMPPLNVTHDSLPTAVHVDMFNADGLCPLSAVGIKDSHLEGKGPQQFLRKGDPDFREPC